LDDPRPPQQPGVPDALRVAIERTLASVGDTRLGGGAELRAETLHRAADLLDEVARRGYDVGAEVARLGRGAGSEIAKRGQDARDASVAITGRVLDAVADTLDRKPKPKPEGD
jgi:hypothetical protein